MVRLLESVVACVYIVATLKSPTSSQGGSQRERERERERDDCVST